MEMEMWQWKAREASEQMDVRVIEAREEAEAETAIDVTHAVIGTLQIQMTHIVLLGETFTVVVGVLVLDQDPLTVIGTIGPGVELDEMTTKELERGAHDVIVTAGEDAHLAPSLRRARPSPLRTNVTEGLSLCSNWLLD